jgi:hypothetical protein
MGKPPLSGEAVVEVGGFRVVVDPKLPPGAMIVTSHNGAETELTPEAKRKRDQREREKAAGVDVIELKFSPAERAEMDEGRTGRGSQGIPYTATEYIKTLIRNDVMRLRNDREKLDGRICKNCQKPLPRGCGGTWGREALCLLARSEIALAL